MKTETIDKLCASYMEDARALKRKFPNREFVLRKVEYAYKAGLEDAYKGIKKMSWETTDYALISVTFVGEFSILPLLKGGLFEVRCDGAPLARRCSLSKAKKFANNVYKQKVKKRLGL